MGLIELYIWDAPVAGPVFSCFAMADASLR
jgi:hypothetical protein